MSPAESYPSARYALRPLAHGHADDIAEWSRDREFCRAAGWTTDLPICKHVDFWRRLIDEPPPELLRFVLLEDDVIVGYTDLHGVAPEARELGFVIGDRARWGRGLGRIGVSLTLERAFGSLGLDRVWAESYEGNTRALQLLDRTGFSRTGVGEPGEYLGARSIYIQLEILREDWLANG